MGGDTASLNCCSTAASHVGRLLGAATPVSCSAVLRRSTMDPGPGATKEILTTA